MPNITPRKNKNGEIISYRIRVFKGYDGAGKQLKPYEMTWKPEPGMTEKRIEKEVQRIATLFEEQCKQGLTGDSRQKFGEYAKYVIDLKEKSGELKHHTVVRYRELLQRVNEGIGHIKLKDIRPQHLNKLYEELAKEGLRKNSGKAVLKSRENLHELISKKGYTSKEAFIREATELSCSTYRKAIKGEKITLESAKKISVALDIDLNKLFAVEYDNRPLSPKTIREHHVLVHLVLHQAECELIIPYNPASKAKPPKADRPTANYFEQEEVNKILEAAERIPLKWKTIIHLLLVTGGRRGEVLGLTWDNIDFTFNRIYVEKCIYYESDIGIYIDKPKTENSVRYIKLPAQTMELIKQYRDEYYIPLKASCGKNWNDGGFLFIQDSGEAAGTPMHPDSITGYCDKFSDRYGLRHINPHAFRHTAASLLYFAGMDTISISARLGHSKPSTTQNIYAHVMAEADSRAADCLGDIILSSRQKRSQENEEQLKIG